MKTEPINEVKQPNNEQERNPAKYIEVEASSEENGSDESPTRRIDNGNVVRNKRLGGKSPKPIRRFGKILKIKGLLTGCDCHCDLFLTANLDNVTT